MPDAPATNPLPLSRYHRLMEKPEAFQEALKRPLHRFVWTNRMRISAQRLTRILEKDGYLLQPLPWSPDAFRVLDEPLPLGTHWSYHAGFFQVQEASSMVPVLLLRPRPGQRILDLCAAPGNKTAQASVFMENRGTVVANDLNPQRMRSVRMHIDRLGLLNVSLTFHEGGSYPKRAGLFDAVLVDVPCSCEGTSRKTPDILSRPVPRREGLLRRQRLLLEAAVRRCRPGGRIVYSTCTFDPEENEAAVDDLIRNHPGQVRLLFARLPGLRFSEGITSWEGRRFDPELRKALRIWPHQNDTGGFFIAMLERIGDNLPEVLTIPAVGDSDYGETPGAMARPLADADRILPLLCDRFGFDPETFHGIALLTPSGRKIFGVSSDHRPPLAPAPASGLPLLHMDMKVPKLTTAGAVHFGLRATRNVVRVNRGQLDKYMARISFELSPAQINGCTSDGHVLIHHNEVIFGVGRVDKARATVHSLFPKRLAGEILLPETSSPS